MDEMTAFLLGQLRQRIAMAQREAIAACKRATACRDLRDTLVRIAQLMESGDSPVNPEALVRAVGPAIFPAVAEDIDVRRYVDREEPDEIPYLCGAFNLSRPDKPPFTLDDLSADPAAG